ncbi:hypothetical protein LDENG_00151140, partial [Lucifuga dentata]
TSEELVLRLNGSEHIEFVIKERFKRDHLLRDLLHDGMNNEGNAKDLIVIDIKFKTQDDGVLMFALGQKGHVVLKIKDQKLVYVSEDSTSGRYEFTVDSVVADGVWHVLSLFSNGQNIFLLLDGKQAMNTTDRDLNLTAVGVDRIVVGAAPPGDSRQS